MYTFPIVVYIVTKIMLLNQKMAYFLGVEKSLFDVTRKLPNSERMANYHTFKGQRESGDPSMFHTKDCLRCNIAKRNSLE